ncbi:hypothetical protein ACI797_17985 [Geodermatophilus sp. SYSU D00691]
MSGAGEPPAATGPLAAGGPYRLLSLLGQGGMGQVWHAHDDEHDRAVALEVLADQLASWWDSPADLDG